MLVYIVGAGAVGTYLGEALRDVGCTVTYAPREVASVVPVAADLAIVAVKSYATEEAIGTLRIALRDAPDATILTPQNGVGNEELLADAFGADRIVSGALTVPVERGSAGTVSAANRGGLALAPVGSVSHNWLFAAFERSRVPAAIVSDYRAMKWSKLALNIVANAACAILDVLPGRLVKMEGMFDFELRGMREVHAVMRAQNLAPIDLPRYPVKAMFAAASLPNALGRALLSQRVAGARGLKPPSLLLDLRAGRGRTENGALGGAVAAAGTKFGIATPVTAAYARVLCEIERDGETWDTYRERPAALRSAVRG